MRYTLFMALALSLLAAGCSERSVAIASPFNASNVSAVDWGKDFQLTDHNGRPRRLADFDDKVVLLFFGFTHCTDVCPTTLADMARVVDQLGADGPRVQVLFVTVDPQRDTPSVLAHYVNAFHPSFLGLYADAARTDAMAREFKFHHAAHAAPAGSNGDYAVEHGSAIYIYGPLRPQGRTRLLASAGRSVATLGADVRGLLEQ